MAKTTNIEWSSMVGPNGEIIRGGTLNIGAGCDIVNPACTNCYAMGVTAGLNSKFHGTAEQLRVVGNETRANELEAMYEGTTKEVNGIQVWTGKITRFPERIDPFIRSRNPAPQFVSSLTDFWHPGYDDEYLADWFGAFAANPTQRILLLTKRPERQMKMLLDEDWRERVLEKARGYVATYGLSHLTVPTTWPLPNVWCGASAGEFKVLEQVLETLLKTPSVCQWLSIEPLYADPRVMDAFRKYSKEERRYLKWAIFGGESGPRSRPMKPEWVERGIEECRELGISPFVKQMGEVLAKEMGLVHKKGGDIKEWPEALRIREYPQL